MNKPKKVFVDNCIFSASSILQPASKIGTVKWGDTIVETDIAGFTMKPLPSEAKDQWKRSQVMVLPTIAQLARNQSVQLFTSSELQHEAWKRRGSFNGGLQGEIFDGISVKWLDAAIERSYFFQSDISEMLQTENVIAYCEWLLESDPDSILRHAPDSMPVEMIENIKNLERFRNLCKAPSKKQYPDVFHLWTAETNGADYFLTIDNKFINMMTKTSKVKLTCIPISPSDLLNELGVTDFVPLEFEEDVFYGLHGRPI